MCGIVAAAAKHDVCPMLLDGLRKLEYRGYDSSGIATLQNGGIQIRRRAGRVNELAKLLLKEPISGHIGVAHTRWATHGVPATHNAHPQISSGRVVVVHNGIIENYLELKKQQKKLGFDFSSDTDSEVIAHQICYYLERGRDLLTAVREAAQDLVGSWALAVLDEREPHRLVGARSGSPLAIGLGDQVNYLTSDVQALAGLTKRFHILEDQKLVILDCDQVEVYDQQLRKMPHREEQIDLHVGFPKLGRFKHFMHKEIHEQPTAVSDTLEGRLHVDTVPDEILGYKAKPVLDRTRGLHIVACGTSYHAALVAKYWCEELAGVPCQAEIASEFRYRKQARHSDSLFIAISQSGETADTLAALEKAKSENYLATLGLCNVAHSTLARSAEFVLLTHAGPEIGVASTKAFTTQLVALMLIVILLTKRKPHQEKVIYSLIQQLRNLPARLQSALLLEPLIAEVAAQISQKSHALFLGRGLHYPIAMEGALKLKEISYLHAEAYAAGELKHGPLALVDTDMPIIAVAPNDHLLNKLKSNLEEVSARGGQLQVFAARGVRLGNEKNTRLIEVDAPENAVSPIIFSLPLQLLAYHCALQKGTDVDKPRNLAKSVTVE